MKRLLFLLLWLPITAVASPFSCGGPVPYCKNMSSCAEAQFYLNQCNAHRLDRDGDGVPCESICGKGGKKQSKKSKQQLKTLLAEQEKEQKEENETDNSNQ